MKIYLKQDKYFDEFIDNFENTTNNYNYQEDYTFIFDNVRYYSRVVDGNEFYASEEELCNYL